MSRLAGMAENSTPSFSITAEEFREGWKVLQKAMYGGIITPQNAIDTYMTFCHTFIDNRANSESYSGKFLNMKKIKAVPKMKQPSY